MRTTAAAPLRSWRRSIFTVFAFIAMAAQLAVALSPLAEGRERSWGSHVEAAGLHQHYAHNEATCAACQARSIHGATGRIRPSVLALRHVATAPAQRSLGIVATDHSSQDNPRAPPTVI
jgi:hypothetical protein